MCPIPSTDPLPFPVYLSEFIPGPFHIRNGWVAPGFVSAEAVISLAQRRQVF